MSRPSKMIDVHTHPQTEEMLAAMGDRRLQMETHFGKKRRAVSFTEMADQYREKAMMAVLLNSDDESVSGVKPASNDPIGRAGEEHPDVFIPFCGIDPWRGAAAVTEVRRCYETWGVRGVGELNPGRQDFYPNDRRFDPIWETCAELGLVVMFHVGFMGGGAGTPGGMGYHLENCRPIPYLDDLAARFPELTIIGAHPGWPWHLDMLAVAWHKANVFMDLSGWAPKYWPSEVIHFAKTLLSDKVLFGTDWPSLDAERWLAEFRALGFDETAQDKILSGNASRIFGLHEE